MTLRSPHGGGLEKDPIACRMGSRIKRSEILRIRSCGGAPGCQPLRLRSTDELEHRTRLDPGRRGRSRRLRRPTARRRVPRRWCRVGEWIGRLRSARCAPGGRPCGRPEVRHGAGGTPHRLRVRRVPRRPAADHRARRRRRRRGRPHADGWRQVASATRSPRSLRPGTGIVVSPLIALMQDQVDALRAVGVRAAFLNSTQDSAERARVEQAYLAGELDLLYVAPERPALRGDAAVPRPGHRSPCSRSTRPTVCRSGATTSVPTTSRSPSSPNAGPTSRASRSPRPPPRRPTRRSPQRLHLGEAQALRLELRPPEHPLPDRAKNEVRKQLLAFMTEHRPATPGSSTACAANGRADSAAPARTTGSTPRRTTPGSTPRVRAARSPASSARTGSSSSRRSRSAWGSTSPTSASSPTSTSRRGGGLLPGDRPRGPRRPPSDRLARLRSAGRRAAAAHDRRVAGRPRAPAQPQAHLDAMFALCETVDCRRVNLLRYFGQQSTPCGNCDTCLEPPESPGTAPCLPRSCSRPSCA